MNAIVEQFECLWRADPSRPLIHLPSRGTVVTADGLQRKRHEFERVLATAGIRSGHLIVSVAGNRPGFLALLLSAWGIGAAVMPVDEDLRDQEVRSLAAAFGAAAIVRARATDAPQSQVLDDELSIQLAAPGSWRCHSGLSLLKLTSGSSGAPKAVGVPAAAILNDTAHIVEAMGIGPDDIQLAVIPLSHAYGFGNLVLPLLWQGTAMVLRESFVPQTVVADARAFQARVMPGVPFMFQHFATHPPADGWPPSLSWLISAGARLEADVTRAFHHQFGLKIHSFYGASECGGIAFDRSEAIHDTATVGWPMPGVTIELRNEDGIPEGHGRVHVRSNAVARGYVGPAGDGTELSGGFLTGDYGHLLPDGRLLLAGRISSFINVAGRKVQPEEVEQQLRAIPEVIDACVLPVTDPVRGEQVAAVVAGNGTLSPYLIRQFCADRLPAYKIPRVIVIVPALPLTSRGKTDTRALQALVNAGPV